MYHVIGVTDTEYGTWSYYCIPFLQVWKVHDDHNDILHRAQLGIELKKIWCAEYAWDNYNLVKTWLHGLIWKQMMRYIVNDNFSSLYLYTYTYVFVTSFICVTT